MTIRLLDGSWYPLISDLCHCNICNKIVYGGHKYISGHNKAMLGHKHSESSKTKTGIGNTKIFLLKLDGSKEIYPSIPSLCLCGCNEIVYNGYEWIVGHSSKGENNPFYNKRHSNEVILYLKEINIGKHFSPNTEFTSESISGKNNPMYGVPSPNTGNITPEETRKKIGDAQRGVLNHRYGKPSPPGVGRGKGAWYYSPCQGYKWLRSTYELAYAEYLDQHNILWYYEELMFPMTININNIDKQTTYRPDFFLPQYNKFIEIKGYLDEEHKLKIEKFYENNSNYLEVLYEQNLKNLGIKI